MGREWCERTPSARTTSGSLVLFSKRWLRSDDGCQIVFLGECGDHFVGTSGAHIRCAYENGLVQTLADGNRIVQTNTGTVSRDSQGRTRQDAALPAIGNLSAASAPHLVFIQDPVAGTSYTLNLTDKTAWKNPMPPAGAGGPGVAVGSGTFFIQTASGVPPIPPATSHDCPND